MSDSGQRGWHDINWDGVAVHFGEIGLKGGNRGPFIKVLRRNLERALAPLGATVTGLFDHLFVKAPAANMAAVLEKAAGIFGVSHAAPVRVLARDMDVMKREALTVFQSVAAPGASFAIRASRSDKRFPLRSQDIEREVGGAVKAATGAPVDLDNPDVLLRLRVHEEAVYLQGPATDGPGGLPAGIADRVLTLFSGGIDSPVAAWLVMKRGCLTDFVHFHVMPDVEAVRQSKIVELIRAVIEPQGLKARLFLAPYHAFEMGVMSASVPHDLELVLFRRFMRRVASELAAREGHAALVTGDSLSQVASQTLENLIAFDDAAAGSVLRPLLTYDKQDTVNLAQRIGTYELSIAPYKDCCSLVARHPQTHPKLHTIRSVEERLPVAEMTKAALDEAVAWNLP